MSYELFVVPPLVALAWLAGLAALVASSSVVRGVAALVAVTAGGAVFWIYIVDGAILGSAPHDGGALAGRVGWDRVVAEASAEWIRSDTCGRLLTWLAAAAVPTIAVGAHMWAGQRARRGLLSALAVVVTLAALFEVVIMSHAAVVFATPHVRGTWPMESARNPPLSDVRWSFGYVEEALETGDADDRVIRCQWLGEALRDPGLRADLVEHVSGARLGAATTACARSR